MTYTSVMLKRHVKAELDEARRKLSLSWTQFFTVALPRCSCGGLVVAQGGTLRCARCGETWRLERAESVDTRLVHTSLVERRRRRGRAGKRSKAVEERLVAVQEYLEKSRVATVGQLARALGLSHTQALYAVRLLNVCYKVVGTYAFVGRTCADVEEHLRREYAKMAETVRRLVDGCRSAVCCARLSAVVSVLTRRDPPRAADMAFYMALLEEYPGGLSARRVAVNKVAVCTHRT